MAFKRDTDHQILWIITCTICWMTCMQKRALYIEAALLVTEDSDSSSEQQLEFFDSQREFHKEDNRHLFKDTTDPLVKENHLTTDYLHKDGFCDCNSQGPWKPLFKASQQIESEFAEQAALNQELSNSIEHNLHDEHFPALPPLESQDFHNHHHHHHDSDNKDLLSHAAGKQRQGKKQNHMIHLHLIPHIYVPVVHPISYSVQENNVEHQQDVNSAELINHDDDNNNVNNINNHGNEEFFNHHQQTAIDDLSIEQQQPAEHSSSSSSGEGHDDSSLEQQYGNSGEAQNFGHYPQQAPIVNNGGDHRQPLYYIHGNTATTNEAVFVQETPTEIIRSHIREHELPPQYIPYGGTASGHRPYILRNSDTSVGHQYQVHEDVGKDIAAASNHHFGFNHNNHNNNNNNHNNHNNYPIGNTIIVDNHTPTITAAASNANNVVISNKHMNRFAKVKSLINDGKLKTTIIDGGSAARNEYGKRYTSSSDFQQQQQMDKTLRYMRPPPLGQRQTWKIRKSLSPMMSKIPSVDNNNNNNNNRIPANGIIINNGYKMNGSKSANIINVSQVKLSSPKLLDANSIQQQPETRINSRRSRHNQLIPPPTPSASSQAIKYIYPVNIKNNKADKTI